MSWLSSTFDNAFGTHTTGMDLTAEFANSWAGQQLGSIDWDPRHSSNFSEYVLPALELPASTLFAGLGAHYGVSSFGDFDRYLRNSLGGESAGVHQASWIDWDADHSNTWTEGVVPTLNFVGAAAVAFFVPWAAPLAIAGNAWVERQVGVEQGKGEWAKWSSTAGAVVGSLANLWNANASEPALEPATGGNTPQGSPGGPAPMPAATAPTPTWTQSIGNTVNSLQTTAQPYVNAYNTGMQYYNTGMQAFNANAPAGPSTTAQPSQTQVPANAFYSPSPTYAQGQGSAFAGSSTVLAVGLGLALLTLSRSKK